jgi:hypothetical protein
LKTSTLSQLPDRADCGIDEDYLEFRAIKGLLIAIAFSLPIWAFLACIAVHFLKKAGH